MDTDGKLQYIDQKSEEKLGMFKEYNNFREARLFKISDTLYVLEISYQPEDKLLRQRQMLSKDEVQKLQQQITEKLKPDIQEITLDQEGRTKLVTWSTILSLGYYGWAIPVAFDIDNEKTAFALYLLSSGAGFFVPLSLTKERQVTDAAATLAVYGLTRGILHGVYFTNFIADDPSIRAILLSGVAVSLAEGFIGFNLANRWDLNAGTAELISVGGDFGFGLGIGTGILADFEDRGLSGSIVTGSAIGLIAGKLLSNTQHYTRGDAFVISGAGVIGAYVPFAIVDMTGSEDVNVFVTSSMLGALGGLWYGNTLITGKDFTTGQGNLIRLGALTGGLLGMGMAYLLAPEGQNNSTLYLTASSLGAIGGFWFMYNSYQNKAGKKDSKVSMDLNINPLGFYALTSERRLLREHDAPPLLNLHIRF